MKELEEMALRRIIKLNGEVNNIIGTIPHTEEFKSQDSKKLHENYIYKGFELSNEIKRWAEAMLNNT